MGKELSELEENLRFSKEVLDYFYWKMTEWDKKCLELVAIHSTDPFGLQVMKIEDYKENRRAYDISFTRLEAQGFIRQGKIATMRPYYLTIRGKQMFEYINKNK
jgi:hypothetical protein